MNIKGKIWWLFCNVIDNFGDIGVGWRLARELHKRLNGNVYLFVDEMAALRGIVPDFEAESGVMVKSWREGEWADTENVPVPDVVIELFACRLPENVLKILKQNQSVWLNWEYLSAEDWAVKTHGMLSLQADGFAKYFWQMGFVAQSGGLLREANIRQPEISEPFELSKKSNLKILIFAYQSEIWEKVFLAWQNLAWQVEVDLFGEQVIESLKQKKFLPANALTENEQTWVSGSLILRKKNFVPQGDFDEILGQYDWLFVRGEDSFVRAQWAAKPLFWHIYPQEEQAHLTKLDAFWQTAFSVCQDHDKTWQQAHWALSQELNGGAVLLDTAREAHWRCLREHALDWQNWARNWQKNLLEQADTVSQLANWLAKSTK